MEVIVWLVVLVAVWGILGFGIARENERVVKIFLGRPYAVAESGPFWIPFLFAWTRRYTTKLFELTFAQRDAEGKIKRDEQGRSVPAGGFVTAAGKTGTGADALNIGPITVGVTISFRFYWPQDEQLLFQCVKRLPAPDDESALRSIFQEPIMDETRSAGCKMTYIALMSERASFASQITDSVKQGKASQLLVDTGLEPSAHVVIDHIDIPPATITAINDEEASRLKARGAVRTAEGERQRLKLEGEGRGQGIKALKDEGGDDALQYESLRTLREMATGTSNTIFVPLDGLKSLVEKILNK